MAVFDPVAKPRLILAIMCVSTLFVCAAVLTLAGIYLYLNPQIPDASTYRDVQLETPLRILSEDGDLLAEFGERRLIPITMDKIPDLFVRAIVDTEDKRFYSHQGVDFISLLNDSVDLLWSGEIKSGASTLTMQLARNVSFSLEQRFIRKFKEMLLAMKIERQLTKNEILNLYINVVPFGKRAYGAEAAAQTYYNKPLAELSLAQLAMLAGIPQAPSTGNPINGPERAINRRNLVLGRMLAEGSITAAEHELAVNEPLTARIRRQGSATAAPYPAELVRQELLNTYPDLYTGGYTVTTTINGKLQRAAIAAVRRGLHSYDERHGYRGAKNHIDVPEQPEQLAQLALVDQALEPLIAAYDKSKDKNKVLPEIALPSLPPVAEDVAARITAMINATPLIGNQLAAVVTAVGEHSIAISLSDNATAIIPWHGLSWARPFISVERTGPSPKNAAEIVTRGDLIQVTVEPSTLALGDATANAAPKSDIDTKAGENVAPYRYRLSEEPELQGALVSLDPSTGAIRALTGGYDFSRNQFNHAMQARRQPGSGFKPFVYSAALDKGITPASIYMDAPIVLEDEGLETQYRPDNDNKRYNGPTRLREALYRSINLVSIRVLLDVTAGRALRHVARFGFDTSNFPRNTQLGVGGGTMGVTPMDMARAYSVFANGGYLITPNLIREVSRDGEILETRNYTQVCRDCEPFEETIVESADTSTSGSESVAQDNANTLITPNEVVPVQYAERVLPEDNAWIMHTMLQDVIKRGTGRKAMVLGRSDLAGKTGTTNEAADTWFNGYNGELATTVWVGFSDNRPLGPREYGSTTPLPIWIDYMREALRDVPMSTQDQPESVVSLKIDPESGEVARPGQFDAIFEYFLEDHQPEPPSDLSPTVYESDQDIDVIETTDLF